MCSADVIDYGEPLEVWAVVQVFHSGTDKRCNVDALVAGRNFGKAL